MLRLQFQAPAARAQQSSHGMHHSTVGVAVVWGHARRWHRQARRHSRASLVEVVVCVVCARAGYKSVARIPPRA
eukprot:2618112-Lingulodinium_polyedra.AAC.1